MFLGALFDIGLDLNQWQQELDKLGVNGYQIHLDRTKKSSISGMQFQVTLNDPHHHIDEGLTSREVAHVSHHTHHHHGRNLKDIMDLIESSKLSDHVKELSLQIFKDIAASEAKVHGLPIEEVHFHEVGALDSIIDVVGVLIGLEILQIDRIVSGELVDGSGTIKVAHGVMPVPVPAVMMIRQGTKIPIRQRTDILTELITPTGLGLVKALVDQFAPMPIGQLLLANGYGFGTRDTGELNALRVCLFDSKNSQKKVTQNHDEILELQTNIDDSTGEQMGYIVNQLLELGVYDTFYTPIYMKKQRPAYKLSVILPQTLQDKVTELLFQMTSTVGVRFQAMQRTMMQRNFKTIQTDDGEVGIKELKYHHLVKHSLEFNDVAKIAQKKKITLAEAEHFIWHNHSIDN